MAARDNERLPILETKVDYAIDLIKQGFAKFDNEITVLKAENTNVKKDFVNLNNNYILTKNDVSNINRLVVFVAFTVLGLVLTTFWGKLTGTHP